MLSVSTGHSADYLTGQVGAGKESYYTGAVGAGEPQGRWWGKGAAALGLSGEVDAEAMHAVYGQFLDPRDERFADQATRGEADRLGRAPKRFRGIEQVVEDRIREYTTEHASTPTPEQIRTWRIEAERDTPKAVGFYDLTFSPDKSVTVLWTSFTRAGHEAREAGDVDAAQRWEWAAAQVEDAVMTAGAAGLDYIERRAAYTRSGRHGGQGATGRWEETHELTVARFLQHTSRDLDPQLHVHQAVLNKATGSDGAWRALDGRALHTARPAAAAISERVLETELSRTLGISWEMREDGIGRRVVGVDQDLEQLFSSRRASITPEAAKRIAAYEEAIGRPANNRERTQFAQDATLATRRAKTHESESTVEQHQRWDAHASAEVAGGLTRQANVFARAWDAAGGHPADGHAPTVAAERFSPQAVISQAVEACHGPDGKSTLTSHDLIRQLDLATPANLGGLAPDAVARLYEDLKDQALASPDVVQVAGHAVGSHQVLRANDATAVTVNPSCVQYAARGHLAAEMAVLRAAGVRGRFALDCDKLDAWLEETGTGAALTEGQRAALRGLATSDAAFAVLVGPAGTGKSYTAGVLDAAWRDLTEGAGRVIGVAPTQVAADVLADDGVSDTANVPAFLTAQLRLAEGRPLPGDDRLRLGAADILVVDEASMLDTPAMTRLQKAVEDAGARLVPMGDPHQLGPVGAGGMMRAAINRDAETYTLSDVRRFTADWERAASLRLRDGDHTAVGDYDSRGRIIDGGREAEAIAALARAAGADQLAGHDVVVVTATNEQAAAVNTAIRGHLAGVGRVGEAGVLLGRDGTPAGVGDLVQARRIDRALGLVNREVYRVEDIHPDGSLAVTSSRTGRGHVMPANYVAADVTLGYASTAHAAQGRTVEVGHVLLTGQLDRAGAYVGLTRGRAANTAWAVTSTGNPDEAPQTGRGLLARALRTDPSGEAAGLKGLDGADAAAVDVAAADDAYRSSAATLLALIEDQTRLACRDRLEADLDTLTADGVLTPGQRAALGAEHGTEHLSRLLRAHEQAGRDPLDVLRHATGGRRSLDDARAVSQVLAARINPDGSLPLPEADAAASALPARITPAHVEHLTELHQLLAERRADLADQIADDAPAWAVAALGAFPAAGSTEQTVTEPTAAPPAATELTAAEAPAAAHEDEVNVGEAEPLDADPVGVWKERAGWIAAQREASGWDDPEHAIGRCPGVHTPEKRAAWHTAYIAAGRPEHRRPEAEMSDGRLLARVRAAELAEAAAPPAVYEAQREEHLAADAARRDAELARAAQDIEAADRFAALAAEHAERADRLDEAADDRGHWLVYYGETIDTGQAAREELITRGKTPGAEPDRTTAAEWLAAEADARTTDDAHRVITENDLAFDDAAGYQAEDVVDATADAGRDPERAHHAEDVTAGQVGDDLLPSAPAVEVELSAAVARARAAHNQLADARSQDQAANEAFDQVFDDGDDWHLNRYLDRDHGAELGTDRSDDHGDALEAGDD